MSSPQAIGICGETAGGECFRKGSGARIGWLPFQASILGAQLSFGFAGFLVNTGLAAPGIELGFVSPES